MIEQILKDIGLTQYESKVYLALLEIGKSTSGEILKKAQLRTGKIYEILDSLEKKGLLSSIAEAGVKKFSPADPRRVYDYLEEQKDKINSQEANLKKAIPEIIAKINQKKDKISIEIFTGMKGLKTAYYKQFDHCSTKNTVYVFGTLASKYYSKEMYDFFKYNLRPKREKTKVNIKKIMNTSGVSERGDHEKQAKIRYLPYGSPLAITVIGSLTLLTIISEEQITITIESQEVAKSFLEQFELMWKIAKP